MTFKEEIAKELKDTDIIDSLRRILSLKLSVEEKLFKFVNSHSEIDAKNLKIVTLAINKTKDNITEIGKLLRLYTGDSTEKIEISDEERNQRRSRLLDMVRELPAG